MARKKKAVKGSKRGAPKKARRSVPYKTVRIYRSAKTGRLVPKNYRGKKKTSVGYISKLTGKRISKKTKSDSAKVQGFREAFPGRTEKTRRRIRATISEYRRMGFNPMEESPGLKRYFAWLRKNKPSLYRPVLKAVGQKMEQGEDLNVNEIQGEFEFTARRRKKKRRSRK